jgi:hypothetical protein
VLSRLTHHMRQNVVAYLALFVALGGTSYAAIRLPANSVGANQIRTNAVRSVDVKNSSLLAADFKRGQLRAGPRGAQGAAGLQGAPGRDGTNGTDGTNGAKGTFGNVEARNEAYTTGPVVTASCLSGEVAVGGGVETNQQAWVRVSKPTPGEGAAPSGWQGQIVNASNVGVAGRVYVVCAVR